MKRKRRLLFTDKQYAAKVEATTPKTIRVPLRMWRAIKTLSEANNVRSHRMMILMLESYLQAAVKRKIIKTPKASEFIHG